MEEYAKEKDIPIMQKDGITFLMKYIKSHNIKNILEIGSAIGYSAILMASVSEDVKVTTIERDEVNYMECLQDALEVNLAEGTKFDLIFIDGAKGQYQKFFEKYEHFLSDNGTIVTDNMKFHGYVGKSSSIESKNLRQLVSKIVQYIDYLRHHEGFDTKFYDVGDGVAVSVRKKNEK